MKLLVDMNLSPDWVNILQKSGWETSHWSAIGNPRAADAEIMLWAKEHGHVILTHDLDFGSLLALTQADAPSVIQVRTQDVSPAAMAPTLLKALHQFQTQLENGALIIVDEARARARVLPLQP